MLKKVSSLWTRTDVRLLDETRRHAVCQTAQQAFLQESATTFTCATTYGSGQGNGTFDSCRPFLEIFLNCIETQQISKIQFRIPELLNRKSIFELSREFFFFSHFFLCFFFFQKKKKLFSQRKRKISETRDMQHLSL